MGKLAGITILLAFALLTSISINNEEDFIETVEEPTTEIILVGDIMLGRTVMTTALNTKGDAKYPFLFVADRLRAADVVFANLENPIIENCPDHYDGFIFCADPRMIEGLQYAGIDIVSLANNHTLNYGSDGLTQTKEYLTNANIDYVEEGRLVIKEINGIKFGFLGFEFLTHEPNEAHYQLIAEIDPKVDVLIVGIHWGAEYQSVSSEKQQQWARELVKAGADVISGHHPHWIQQHETINGKPVYYSLGNFVFDQMWSEETKSGHAVKLIYSGKALIKEEQMKVYMKNWSQPIWIN